MLEGSVCRFFALADIRKESLIDRFPVLCLKYFIDVLLLLLQMPLLLSKPFLTIADLIRHSLAQGWKSELRLFFKAAADEDCLEDRVSFFEVMLRLVEKVRVIVAEAMKA